MRKLLASTFSLVLVLQLAGCTPPDAPSAPKIDPNAAPVAPATASPDAVGKGKTELGAAPSSVD